jgi:hypothetical protein
MENIFTSSSSILLQAKVFGFFPMSFEVPARKGIFKVKWYNLVATFISAVLQIVLFSEFFVQTNGTAPTEIITIAWSATRNLEGFFYFIFFCCQIWNRRKVVKFLELLFEVDGNLCIQIDHKKHKKISSTFTITSIVIASIYSSVISLMRYFQGYDNQVILIPRFFVQQNFKIFFLVQFILASFALRERFRLINDFFATAKVTKISLNQKFGKIYNKLCDAIEIVNSTLTFQFIPIFGSFLVSLNT